MVNEVHSHAPEFHIGIGIINLTGRAPSQGQLAGYPHRIDIGYLPEISRAISNAINPAPTTGSRRGSFTSA